MESSVSIISELWMIFSYYTLHANPMQPDLLKATHLTKFLKDTQIVSPRLHYNVVELEIVKAIRKIRPADFEYSNVIAFTFNEFVSILDTLATLVYPKNNPEVAARRLLLENVFLLASRRITTFTALTEKYVEGMKVLKETFAEGLLNIFHHYAAISEGVRRKALLEANSLRGSDSHLTPLNSSEPAKRRKKPVFGEDEMAYREYTVFSQDFQLKSLNLLTAIQLGDIFLSSVPIRESDVAAGTSVRYLTSDAFFEVLLRMAIMAFRDIPEEVANDACRVKALLLYMWKAINIGCTEKMDKQVIVRGPNTSQLHSGSLNVFGSGVFSEAFLKMWQKEGFPDYIVSVEDNTIDGGQLLQRIATKVGGGGARSSKDKKKDEGDASSPAKATSSSSSSGASAVADGGNAEGSESSAPGPETEELTSLLQLPQRSSIYPHSGIPKDGKVTIRGGDLKELFANNPELIELVLIEMKTMDTDSG